MLLFILVDTSECYTSRPSHSQAVQRLIAMTQVPDAGGLGLAVASRSGGSMISELKTILILTDQICN